MMEAKKLNPKQVKFIELYTAGGVSRGKAYSIAYDVEDNDQAKKSAWTLIAKNCEVKATIDRVLEKGLQHAKDRLRAEAGPTVERLVMLREMGNKEYTVQMAACKDILDRIGLKPKEEVEVSGEVTVNLLDVVLERGKKAGEGKDG